MANILYKKESYNQEGSSTLIYTNIHINKFTYLCILDDFISITFILYKAFYFHLESIGNHKEYNISYLSAFANLILMF